MRYKKIFRLSVTQEEIGFLCKVLIKYKNENIERQIFEKLKPFIEEIKEINKLNKKIAY